jgi:guanylate kinase
LHFVPARLTVLSGPSGVGKGSVVAVLRRLVPQVWVSVSCTTRAPRAGETDGIEYHFIDRPEFARMRAADELIESDEHFGNWYGTPREPVLEHLEAGVPTLLEIDLEGARQVRASMPDTQFVFLAPPSLDVLMHRLAGRGTESAAAIVARLDRAALELAAEEEFDEVVVNEDVEKAARAVAALILERD